ncbi:hypothetical protein T10_3132 [Trichinella papuae]|uniref:Uncharacterized protein n=1 Tax=Trichinella papuae TaxID=268474 RepID=A0A0V1MZM8_9BILA|nr:hypothetical protein T10_3132 [Trichinella papuae]
MERREFVQKAHYHDVTECLFFSSSVFEEAVTAWCRNGLQLQEFPLDSFIYVRLEPPLQHFDVFCEGYVGGSEFLSVVLRQSNNLQLKISHEIAMSKNRAEILCSLCFNFEPTSSRKKKSGKNNLHVVPEFLSK